MADFISEQTIQEVIMQSDIVSVISSYVSLQKRGNRYVGLCPFHREKTPSFTVSPDKHMFYCFGCGAGGTVVNFVMRAENFSFPEAIRFLAEKAGINIEVEESGKSKEEYSEKKRIYEMNKLAARFFCKNLTDKSAAECVLYINKRGLTKKACTDFGIGYSLDSSRALQDFLLSQGFSLKDLKISGLFGERENGTLFDKFRNRLMFPIIDPFGNVVGFGGRVLGDGVPKYLNSPDTPAFNKSNQLYALNIAKNTSKGYFIVCEGYMDVIAMHCAGIDNAIASLGTAFTKQHARIIKKHVPKVYLCYDSDDAGVRAATRAIDILTEESLKVYVISLKGAKDPDEFIKKYGVDSFESSIDGAEYYIDYKLRHIKNGLDMGKTEGKIAFITGAAGIFAKIENNVEKEVYVKKICEEFNISEASLEAEIKKIKSGSAGGSIFLGSAADRKPSKAIEEDKLLKEAQKGLICLIAADNSFFQRFSNEHGADFFADTFYSEVYKKITEIYKEKPKISEVDLFSAFSPENGGKISEILSYNTAFENKENAFKELISTIKNRTRLYSINKTQSVDELKKLFDSRKNALQ